MILHCNFCEKTFNDASNRTRHEQIIHNKKGSRSRRKQDRVTCPLCTSTFSRLDNLNLHLKRIHHYNSINKLGKSEKRFFECFHCNERFTLAEKEDLLNHLILKHFPNLKEKMLHNLRTFSHRFMEKAIKCDDGTYTCRNCLQAGYKKTGIYHHVRCVS